VTAEHPHDWSFGNGGFAKLYGDRLAGSSLLECAVASRWVFVFMLAQADAEGRVRCASVAGLARAAGVSLPEAEAALRELEAPDPDSTSKDHEGRRVLRIPGGWQIVTYQKYREYQTKRQRNEAAKKRKQREAARQKRLEREAELARREAEVEQQEQAIGDMSRDVPGMSLGHRHQTSDVKRQTPLPPQPPQGGKSEGGLEASRSRKARGASSEASPEAVAGAGRFVVAFNSVFQRRVSVLPDLVRDFDSRIRDGYDPEQLIALPILTAARGLPDDLRKALLPTWLLRNGAHPRIRVDGTTAGAKNWVSDTLGQADRTRLWPQHVEVARAVGVLDTLLALGARVVEGAD